MIAEMCRTVALQETCNSPLSRGYTGNKGRISVGKDIICFPAAAAAVCME